MLKARKDRFTAESMPNAAFADTLRRNAVLPFEAARGEDRFSHLGLSTLQTVSQQLEGPFGLHAPTLFAALGALAGYAAKWAVSLDIEEGLAPDDRRRLPGPGGRDGVDSAQVRALVSGLGGPSVLSIVLGGATRAGAVAFGDLAALSRRAPAACAPNAMPDYGLADRLMPHYPPEALLMMLWETVGRGFRQEGRPRSDLALGLAFGAAHALGAWRDHMRADTAAVLIVESALAMAAIDRAF